MPQSASRARILALDGDGWVRCRKPLRIRMAVRQGFELSIFTLLERLKMHIMHPVCTDLQRVREGLLQKVSRCRQPFDNRRIVIFWRADSCRYRICLHFGSLVWNEDRLQLLRGRGRVQPCRLPLGKIPSAFRPKRRKRFALVRC